jgi:hypothetical protein
MAETNFDPVFEVEKDFVDGKPLYHVLLSEGNLNNVCAGFPTMDRIYGRANDGIEFHIFEGGLSRILPTSFTMMSDNMRGYCAEMSTPTPNLPEDLSDLQAMERESQRVLRELERQIRVSNPIPIEIRPGSGISLGYVKLDIKNRF